MGRPLFNGRPYLSTCRWVGHKRAELNGPTVTIKGLFILNAAVVASPFRSACEAPPPTKDSGSGRGGRAERGARIWISSEASAYRCFSADHGFRELHRQERRLQEAPGQIGEQGTVGVGISDLVEGLKI